MNIVRNCILFEKFTEDSDPIADIGIGMLALFKKWLKEECTVKHPFDETDYLWISAKYNQPEFLEYFIKKGYDVNAYDGRALRWASHYGYANIVKILLDAGADVHVEYDNSLYYAASSENLKVVKLLLNAGANVNNGLRSNLKLNTIKHKEIRRLLRERIQQEDNYHIKESLNEKFTEDSDPIQDMGIGLKNQLQKLLDDNPHLKYRVTPDPKDYRRIRDIQSKAKGDLEKEKRLASTMAKLITDHEKAYRRYLAAKYFGGDEWEVTNIFLIKVLEIYKMI